MIAGTILFNNYLNYLYILYNSSEYKGLIWTRLSPSVVLDKSDVTISDYL